MGLSALPIIFISVYGVYSNVKTMERVALESLTHDVHTIRERTGSFMAGVESDLLALSNSFLLQQYIRSNERGTTGTSKELLRQIGDELLAFARTKGIYYQIRIVDEERNETLRIESDNITDSTFRWNILSADRLRRGGDRYYFLLTENLPAGQIAFSPVELVYHADKRIPAISYAMPLYGSRKRIGILIANVFAGNLFQGMQTRRTLGVDEKVVLVAGDGHYVYDSGERNNWNKLIASREEDNLQKDYPPAVVRKIVSGEEGIEMEGSDDIIAYAPLLSSRTPGRVGQPGAGFTESLFVFESVPRVTVTQDARSFAVTFAGFLALFLAGAIGLGLLATQQFTNPISEVQRGAEIISGGNYRERLRVETGDEIEQLARQFNAMATSLEEHEKEIQQHRMHLEEMVEHRTRELVEEKVKLQAILDNVSSAFVLLDRHCRIQTASAAFASITGLRLEDVLGQDSRVVFRNKGICQQVPSHNDILPEKTESHVDRTVDRTGTEHFIEHITIPIAENGDVTSILQIITDITNRKRLEQHLIQSEKLMATGEMSAIIAHGFRNSLTSIKMILQLQHESKHLGSANRKSLGVALDSIHRMEMIVQELLNFARPSPMEFRPDDINDMVNESLRLVQPRVREQRIIVKKKLDGKLPVMRLDAPHFREALVNILLNAVQAIESRAWDGKKRTLTIFTKKTVLSRTLRDFNLPDTNEGRTGVSSGNGPEITLRKGTDCAVISVSDTGSGIDRTVLRRIFDPFFTTKTNGTGLGLPMVKRTVNAHGGIVVVKSIKGKGATLEIVLPLRSTPDIAFSSSKLRGPS